MISRKAKKLVPAREQLQALTPAELTEVSGGGDGDGWGAAAAAATGRLGLGRRLGMPPQLAPPLAPWDRWGYEVVVTRVTLNGAGGRSGTLCPPASSRQAAQLPGGRPTARHARAGSPDCCFVPYGPEELARYCRPDRLPQGPGTARLADEGGSLDLP